MSSTKSSVAVIVEIADLANEDHRRDVVRLIDMYAQDAMGGGQPLRDDVRRELIDRLRAHPTTLIFTARDGESTEALGIAVCFLGFSTFHARPLMNIHDLAVTPDARGRGVGRALLEAVERESMARGCCKLTLEVLARNEPARRLYKAFGFVGSDSSATDDSMLFCTMNLPDARA